MDTPLLGAIEAGGTKFVVAALRPDGEILVRERIPTTTAAQTMPQVLAVFAAAVARFGPLAGIGIASFGPIEVNPASPRYGTILRTPKPGWTGESYRTWLEPLGVPLRIETDVNGAALGEWREGAGQGCETLAYTTVGTGIGTGVIHRGKPLAGFGHYEAGHIRVPRDPATDTFPGACPYHGDCLEGLAAGPAISARFGTPLDGMADPSGAVELIAGYLGDLAANLVLLHAPDRLIFGGGVMKAPGLLAAVRRATVKRLGGYVDHPRLDPGLETYIVGPALHDDAGIIGGKLLARDAIALGRNAA